MESAAAEGHSPIGARRRPMACAREQHLDFADAYILASVQVEELDGLATFNQRHFRKAGITLLP